MRRIGSALLANMRSILSRLEWRLAATAISTAALIWLASSTVSGNIVRERLFDVFAGWYVGGSVVDPELIVVDIDRASLKKLGAWPWSRDVLARLVSAVLQAEPRAVALDILLEGSDLRSPAVLASRLADFTENVSIQELAKHLPHGDRTLAKSISQAPLVLGAAQDPAPRYNSPVLRPIMIRGQLDAQSFVSSGGLIAPIPELLSKAAGLGTLAILGDADGTVRRVPLLTIAEGKLVPSLALELLRVASAQPLLVIDAEAGNVIVGRHAIPFGREGLLRLAPHDPSAGNFRRVSAIDVLDRKPRIVDHLRDKVILVGGSAPELGGLRPTSDGQVVASTALQADAYTQLVNGQVLIRPAIIQWLEIISIFVGAGLATFVAVRYPPIRAAFMVLGCAIVWIGWIVALVIVSGVLIDPLVATVASLASLVIAGLLIAAERRCQSARMQARFECHLSPAVVHRIARQTAPLRLEGEVREVTALFTDIEGYTAMTNRAEPSELISVLDGYFDGLTKIAVSHGAFVDKIVGDAMHALFNVPMDLDNHPRRALDCAEAIVQFAMDYRNGAAAKAIGLGRTRIGLETGRAIVGDVGGRHKLDYTAHGDVACVAARLERENRRLGTTILVGPNAAEMLPRNRLIPVGELELRGLPGARQVFTVRSKDSLPSNWIGNREAAKVTDNFYVNAADADLEVAV